MKYLRNIIYRKINDGFSLFELILSVSIGTFILLTVVSGMFTLYRGFSNTKVDSARITEISDFTNKIITDVLNADLFPHHSFISTDETDDVYIFDSQSITFFANNKKVKYSFVEETNKNMKNYFEIIYDEKDSKKYIFIKDFKIKYYDKDDFEILDFYNDDLADYCELYFKFYDNTKLKLNMKL